jgi:HupE / UreJ protein
MMKGRLSALIALFAVSLATEAHAHNLGESYLYLQIYSDRMAGRFEISFEDLNKGFGLTRTEREITPANVDQQIAFLQTYYMEHVGLFVEGRRLPIRFTGHSVLDVSGGFLLMPFEFVGLDQVPQKLTIDYRVLFDEVPGHRGFLLVEHNWATGTFANEGQISLIFSPGSTRQEFDIVSGRLRGFLAVVRLGTEHIWMGVDHVMFLVALLLPAVLVRQDGRWRDGADFMPALINVVKIVTAFTAAHSVTLSLAALGLVRLPGRPVEVIIAASIAIAAADLVYPVFRGRIWLVVFGFGLFHGFGFAGALEEMGLLRENLGLSLFGFNLGVELGQLAIVTLLFPILFASRRLVAYRQLLLPAAATMMIVISIGWVLERAFDVELPGVGTVVSMARGALL